MEYIKVFRNHSDYEDFVESGEMLRPNVSHCVNENEVHYNPHTFADEYFTTVARENGTISFNIWKSMGTDMITSISYSTDNGETWITTNNTDNKTTNLVIDVNVNNGDKVMWKGDAQQLGYINEDEGDVVGSFFSSDCEFDTQGNVMSLLYGDNFKGQTDLTEKDGAFCALFFDSNEEKTCGIVNAKDLSLPATTLANGCYYNMFYGCTSLTAVPELPATTLVNGCYSNMFNGCTSLAIAPMLPATILANGCYESMFFDCTNLTTAPELPATTLADSCYSYMFYGCTSLTTAPSILPATTLADSCYNEMFGGCSSLTTAPDLPATTLASKCYGYMFNGCSNLNYIKAMFTTTPSDTYTSNWVYRVASTGTFVKNSAATWNVTGVHGIPTGWTVQKATA